MKNFNENDIRVAAYYNWLNSGCQNGNDLQNWNLALQQLANNTSAKASSKTISTKAAAIKTISKTSSSKTSSAKKKK